MTLIPIAPTGAMASGDYTDYMITYLNAAIDDLDDQLDSYSAGSVVDDWHIQWDRQVSDISADVTALTSDINKIKATLSMIKDGINKL